MRAKSGGLPHVVASLADQLALRDGMFCRVPLFALLGWAASDVPALLHGASTSWMWSVLSALVCVTAERLAARWPGRHCSRLAMLNCTVSIGLAMTLDFMIVPPEAILALCSSRLASGFWSGMAFSAYDHLRWFPVTLLVMLTLMTAQHIHRWRVSLPGQAMIMPTLGAGCRIALEFCTMLAAMALGMVGLRSLALEYRLPWTANAMASVMLVSMFACLLLRAWMCVVAAAVLKAVSRGSEKLK